jgi:CHAT domain-containing protein
VCGTNADQFGTYWVSFHEGDRKSDWTQAAAEAYYSAGKEWGERLKSSRALSWMSLGMGRYFMQRSQWELAEKYYEDSVARAGDNNFVYGQWAAALERGRLFVRRRRYDQAVGEFQSALELSKRLRASEETETPVLIEFGNMYYSTARPDLAKVYFRAATRQAELSGLPTMLVKLYIAQNDSLQSQDKESAIDYAEKAYSLRGGVDSALELEAIHALAGTYVFLQPGKSREGFKLAVEMRDKARRAGWPDQEVAALTLMSMAKYAANNVDEMIDLAGEAFELTNPEDENPNPRRVTLQLQAQGEMLKGNHQAAIQWCLKALQTVEMAWAQEGMEELRRELMSQSRAICTQIIKNLYELNSRNPSPEYARLAFDFAERSRSRSLLEQLLKSEGHKDVLIDPGLLSRDQELWRKMSAVRGQLAQLRASNHASRETLYQLEDQRSGLIADRIRLQAEINDSIGDGFRAAHIAPLTAEQVQRELVEHYPNSVILYYQLGIQESFLIVLTSGGYHFFKLPAWTTISKAVSEWRAQVLAQQNSQQPGQSQAVYERIAHSLYEILIKPAAHLTQGRDLIIVPSDTLSTLAFEALVVRQGGSSPASRPLYLVQKHAISYAPSISVLAEIESRPRMTRHGGQILLLGDVSGENDVELALQREPLGAQGLDGLPEARREVLKIAQLAEQGGIRPTIWLGSDAREDRFKSADLAAFRFIHIATHSVSDKRDGEASALNLSRDPGGSEDGILTSGEAARLKLNSDLIVLSGCETGIGQEGGAEGTVGFNRTFLLTGARSVCGSLWQVEDTWTERLMTAFYRRLVSGRFDKSNALRLAKLELLNQGANPSQWAAFTLVGTPR